MGDYNIKGNPVANAIYDNFLKGGEDIPKYDGPIPEKPEGLNELPPNINMSAPQIKNLSDMKRNTPQEQYEHDVQMANPASAYARKQNKDLEKLIEVAEEAGVLDDDGADTLNISFDDANKSSAEDLLPGGDETKSEEQSNVGGEGEGSGGDGSDNNGGGGEGDGSGQGSSDNNNNGSGSGSGGSNDDGSGNGNGGGDGGKKTEEEKKKGKYRLRSIMDAYNEGLLDENSRDYLIVDALSTFARNTGRDLGNLAAAYTGGTVNNDRDTSIWEERNKAMAEKGIGAEGNQYRAGDEYDLGYQSQEADLESQRLANAKEHIKMVPAKNFQEAAKKMREEGNEAGAAIMDLVAAASTSGVDTEEYIAAAYANDPNVKKLVDNSMGALSNMAGVIGDLTGDLKELLEHIRNKPQSNSQKSTGRRIADAAFAGNPLYDVATSFIDKK